MIWIDGNGCGNVQGGGGSCKGSGGGTVGAAIMLTPLKEETEGGEDARSRKNQQGPRRSFCFLGVDARID